MRDGAVVDSSVFTAVLLREPGWRAHSTRLASLGIVRSAPFFRFECANALWKQRRAMEPGVAHEALDLLWRLPVNDEFGGVDARAALSIGAEHGLPFYDSAFIALARGSGLPLWTLDGGQARVAQSCGIPVI